MVTTAEPLSSVRDIADGHFFIVVPSTGGVIEIGPKTAGPPYHAVICAQAGAVTGAFTASERAAILAYPSVAPATIVLSDDASCDVLLSDSFLRMLDLDDLQLVVLLDRVHTTTPTGVVTKPAIDDFLARQPFRREPRMMGIAGDGGDGAFPAWGTALPRAAVPCREPGCGWITYFVEVDRRNLPMCGNPGLPAHRVRLRPPV